MFKNIIEKRMTNSVGFSLVEVMITGSILVGMGIASMKLIENQKNGSLNTARSLLIQNRTELIRNIVSNKEFCEENFIGLDSTIDHDIAQLIYTNNGSTKKIAQVGQTYSDARAGIKINKIILKDIKLAEPYLEIEYENMRKIGIKSSKQRIPLFPIIENDKIKSCYKDIDAMMQNTCEVILKGDYKNEKCIYETKNKTIKINKKINNCGNGSVSDFDILNNMLPFFKALEKIDIIYIGKEGTAQVTHTISDLASDSNFVKKWGGGKYFQVSSHFDSLRKTVTWGASAGGWGGCQGCGGCNASVEMKEINLYYKDQETEVGVVIKD